MHCAYERDDTNISQLNVKYSSINVEGRLNTVTHHVDELPENCSVRDLELRMYDLLGVSPRQPMELRYFGKSLDSKKLLKDYAIRDPFMPMGHRDKDGVGYDAESHLRSYTEGLKAGVLGLSGGDGALAEITVVVKPKLLKGQPVPGGDVPFKRVRLASNKLQQPLSLEGVSGETTVLELKQMVTALLKTKETRVFLAHAAVPADERIDTETCKSIDLFMGDHLALEQESFGGKKGTNKVKRMRDGERAAPCRCEPPHPRHACATGPRAPCRLKNASEPLRLCVTAGVVGLMNETDATLLELTPEDQTMFFEGLVMSDATTLASYELVRATSFSPPSDPTPVPLVAVTDVERRAPWLAGAQRAALRRFPVAVARPRGGAGCRGGEERSEGR
tara:strand:- start:2657 stop:3829 length:1173 start_codon:yes stop_codon:yes gene_type:complete|eukprot:scaffold33395_cov62-Phaeocystis_antarctica.AAC.10